VAVGDQIEIDISLEYLMRQQDVSREKDLSVTKCKIAAGKGFWRPREFYKIAFSAATAPRNASPADGRKPPPKLHSYEVTLGSDANQQIGRALQDILYMMGVDEIAVVTAPAEKMLPWPKGGPADFPITASDGTVCLWIRVDRMTRVEDYADKQLFKETLNDDDFEWVEKAFVDNKGQLPMLDEDVLVEMGVGAEDGDGKTLFVADRKLPFRTGDMPLAKDYMLQVFMTMYHGEKAKLKATGEVATQMLEAICAMRKTHGGCPIDLTSAGPHVANRGLTLSVTILNHQMPQQKDGVTGEVLLAAVENLKDRANALLNAGYVAGAMRKYVRATWLMQDGIAKDDPSQPMTEVVGIAKGDPSDGPLKHRFEPSQAAQVKALRVSLHLNLAAGALRLEENYGALAAARVARELEPGAVKPIYREAQALVALQEYTEATSVLKQLLQIEPNNGPARRLLATAKEQQKEVSTAIKKNFSGMFSRAQREAPLYTKADIERTTALERERTRYVADRAEERRRGMQMLDVQAISRLPEEYQQKQIDEMNEAIENDHKQSEIPEGLSADMFKRLLQMRTDGDKEELIQAEMSRMKREEMENARQWMLPSEVERMRERQQAIERDRYKADEVVAEREAEMWDEFKQIKLRVDKRIPLHEAEKRRQEDLAAETKRVLDDENADEEDKSRAIRKMLHDPFKDLDGHLTDAEMYELNELKHKGENDAASQERLQGLLGKATERRIEAKIDELLDREDDVLV